MNPHWFDCTCWIEDGVALGILDSAASPISTHISKVVPMFFNTGGATYLPGKTY